MKNRLLFYVFLSFMILSSCSFITYQPIRFEDYSAKQQIFDLTFGWNKSISDNKLTIDGYARNNRYYIVNNLELWISLVAKDGRVKARNSFFFIPLDIHLDESERFTISLNAVPEPGDKLRFFYRYSAYDDEDSAFTWVNSFEVNAL